MEFHSYSKNCAFTSVDAIRGKHVTVMGLGLNGGGIAAVRFFLKKGAFVTVTDMKTAEQLKASVDELNNDKTLPLDHLTYRLGEHRIEDFENADCVIKNPGVKYDGNKYLARAKAIETDLSIFLRFTECPIIAVTGSKGKSSTVSAIYYGLKTAGYKTFLGGNITVSPLTFFDEVSLDTPVVIEFSSWQLADLRGRGVLKPHIAIITKIVPDHQNWYGNMEDYVADKRLIYADEDSGDYSIFDYDGDEPGTGPDSADPRNKNLDCFRWGNLFASESKGTVLRYAKEKFEQPENGKKIYGVWQEKGPHNTWVGKVLLPQMKKPETILRGLSVPGEHMKTNVLNAALVLYLMGIPAAKTAEILGGWTGIEHRLQYFYDWKNSGGVNFKFYNDSCATVPEAAAAASQSFGKSVIFMTGGTDKGLDLAPLANVLVQKGNLNELNENGIIPVKDIYLLKGTATDKLLPELDKNQIKYHGPFGSLEELFAEAKANLGQMKGENKSGNEEVFVFSPGATSFGMFSNEFDRGNKYMDGIKKSFIK